MKGLHFKLKAAELCKNLETVEVRVEAVATGNVTNNLHDELTIDLRPNVHQVWNLQGFPSMPWDRQAEQTLKNYSKQIQI